MRRLAAAGAAAIVVGLAACAGAGGDDGDATADMAAEATAAAATVVAGDAAGRGEAREEGGYGVVADAPVGAEALQQVGQQLAIEAHATMQTDDVRAAVDRITTTVASRGGRIASADIDYAATSDDDDTDTSRATLVVAIPPDQLGAVRGVLDETGDVLSYDQLAEDVTEQLADLDTRIANQRASIERIRELYANAVDVDAVVRIEAELTSRETVLEQLLASQQAITDRVAMSTLTIDIATTPEAVSPTDDDPGLGDALAGGWSAFAGGVFAVVLALTAAMPFVLTALVIAVVTLVVRSRHVRRTPSPRPPESEPLREAVASRPE